jgi:hypothetical protein
MGESTRARAPAVPGDHGRLASWDRVIAQISFVTAEIKLVIAQIKPGTTQIKLVIAQIKPGTAQIKPGTAQIKPGTTQIKLEIAEKSLKIRVSDGKMRPSMTETAQEGVENSRKSWVFSVFGRGQRFWWNAARHA